MNFAKLTDDLFDRQHYSRNELNLFAGHHVSALESLPNLPMPASMVSATKASYTAYQASLGLLATKGAQQVGGTITREDAKEEVIAFISRKEGLVKSHFGKKSAAYAEFYPQGVSEYATATVEGLLALLERYYAIADKYKAIVGEAFVGEFDQLRLQYAEVRQSQSTGITLNKDAQAQVREARKALTLQLTRNVLTIAAACIESPDAFGRWFNFGLLEADNRPGNTTEVPTQG